MNKTYTTTVKAEVFDGSDEMMSHYPIRHYSHAWGESWFLDIPSRLTPGQNNPSDLLKGQYIVTNSNSCVFNMWPNDFYDLFPEVEK